MKTLMIKLLILPRGMAMVATLSAIAVLLLHVSPSLVTTSTRSEREEFPSGRRGGGTHWITPLEAMRMPSA